MQVTSIEELLKIKNTNIVELPSFDNGTPFVAELSKPNMMQLLASGKIPNTLLNTTMDMFVKGKANEVTNKAINDAKSLTELVKLMDVLADACLVNPSYEDIKKANIQLTENQLMAIMMYAQGGVERLKPFCDKLKNNIGTESSDEVQ